MEETRVINERGGAKGAKEAEPARIPPDVLMEFSRHWGRGAAKYPDLRGRGNWTYVSDMNLFKNALFRHLLQYLSGESFDEETGSHHLIAVAWHAFALRAHELHPEWQVPEWQVDDWEVSAPPLSEEAFYAAIRRAENPPVPGHQRTP